jgi:hypothetical protein
VNHPDKQAGEDTDRRRSLRALRFVLYRGLWQWGLALFGLGMLVLLAMEGLAGLTETRILSVAAAGFGTGVAVAVVILLVTHRADRD